MENYKERYDFSENGRKEFYDNLIREMKKLVDREGNVTAIIREEKVSQFNVLETKRNIYESMRQKYSNGLKMIAKAKLNYFKVNRKEKKSIDDEILLDNLKKSIEQYEKTIKELSVSGEEDMKRINMGIEELILMETN